jgi:transketolase
MAVSSAQDASLSVPELQEEARQQRRLIIEMTTAAGSGHPSSSFSSVEILTTLFFAGLLRHDPRDPQWRDRDRIILSKGHAVPALYAALARRGYFPERELMTLRQIGSPFEGHPNMRRVPGVEASTGSLGQGLSIGLGVALAGRLNGQAYRTWVLLGDGEMDEGQVWEAAMAAAKYGEARLIAIVDANGYQQTGSTRDVMPTEPKSPKWEAFGWSTQEVDGHNFAELLPALERAARPAGRPAVVIARTRKGHGVSFVEADYTYHGKALSPDEARRAIEELGWK